MTKQRHITPILTHTISLCLLALFFVACQKELKMDGIDEPDHNIVINFRPVVQFDNQPMYFDTVTYKNEFNESFKVSAFKFYIHGIELMNTDSNKIYRAGDQDYYLIDFADSNSTTIKLNVLPYKYNRIAFTMGVDSVLNVSGAQDGVLDPAQGMFWEWNTGYIMAKLEGTSPASTAPANTFKYHIGGFRQSESVIKKIILLFPMNNDIDMKSKGKTDLTISADVYDWFSNPHDIRISANAGVMMPGALAQQIADNYSKMFTVVEVTNN
ncbi:MbnP family protein [Paraflavitalea pollutisoli]|uniref:MbnP family protein n=1 Tax=Paraflavitalea pollutisoli TaxID=3034143 RepID=UPI0023EC7B82|nr:MbnP family protein [Paraflavitalea sp. H1-2-19X]